MADCTTLVQGYGSTSAQASCLPHTGMDVLPVVMIAIALLAIGITLRLLVRQR